MPTTRMFALVAIVFASLACATQSSPKAEGVPLTDTPRTSPELISQAELSDPSIGDADALSVIKRLRPAFLATRGGAGVSMSSPVTGVHATINGGPLQPVAALTNIRASEIVEIRYLNAAAAAQAYGSAAGAAGVIVVKRK